MTSLSWITQYLNQIVIGAVVIGVMILLAIRIFRAVQKKPNPVQSKDLDSPTTDANSTPPPPGAPSILSPSSVAKRATETAQSRSSDVASTSQGTVVTVDGVEFVQLEPRHLRRLRIVAQALDNQWEGRRLLEVMRSSFNNGKPLGLADIRPMRYEAGRGEYVRALLNAEQLVVNRVFMYNTDYLAEDFLGQGESRDALRELLTSQVLVPFLVDEHSPAEEPPNVEHVKKAHEGWDRLCREARAGAVRLSWDDSVNDTEKKRLFGSFATWLNNLGMFNQYGDIRLLAAELGLPNDEESARALSRQFFEVAKWALDTAQAGEGIYRGAFYGRFVVDDPKKVTDGVIDFGKPFASELKQIADLSYATNLPDALGGFALTPMDSLPRTALQELTFQRNQTLKPIEPDQIRLLLQREAFSLIQGGQFLRSMSLLSLRDVIALRATDEWVRYKDALTGLLDDPLAFEDKAQQVYDAYIHLARQMNRRVEAKVIEDWTERWMPVLKLVLTMGSSAVTFQWNPLNASGASGKVLYSVTEGAINLGATMTARMIIGGVAGRRAEADLEASLDFMRRSLADARGAFKDLTGWLAYQPNFQNITGQPDTSHDETDPNINAPD